VVYSGKMWIIMELSLQDTSARNRIRTLLIEGKNIKQIQEELGISPGTWDTYYWRDDKGFRQFIIEAQNERLKTIARKNINDIISMPDREDDIRYLKIKADMTAFVAETLDKENFSKKTEENTDKTPINIAINNYKRIQSYKKAVSKELPPPNKP